MSRMYLLAQRLSELPRGDGLVRSLQAIAFNKNFTDG